MSVSSPDPGGNEALPASAPKLLRSTFTVADRSLVVFVDLVPVGRERVPLAAELVDALAGHVARLGVADVGVERVAGERLAQRRPDLGARTAARAHRALVLLEEVQRAA